MSNVSSCSHSEIPNSRMNLSNVRSVYRRPQVEVSDKGSDTSFAGHVRTQIVVTIVAKMRRLNALYKTLNGFLPLVSRFWEFWDYRLKSRLHLNHIPVHKTHSPKITNMRTTSLSAGLPRKDS